MGRSELTITEGLPTRNDLNEAAVVSARAFHTDPFFEYLAPPAMLRSRGMNLFMRTMLGNLGPLGVIKVARREDRIAGVAAWVAPGGYPFPARQQRAQTAGIARAFAPRPSMAPLGFRYMRSIEKHHTHEPHWYLAVLTTDPEQQGTGVGSALITPVLEQCDREGLVAYLETQKESNLSWYGRFGFDVVDKLEPVDQGPAVWTLRRPAKP
jgi:GNAT superfamily N-acetyltransferase